jgi:hypothetical protein
MKDTCRRRVTQGGNSLSIDGEINVRQLAKDLMEKEGLW